MTNTVPTGAPKPPRYKRVWIKIRRSKPVRWRRGWQRIEQPHPRSWRAVMLEAMEWAVRNTRQIHYGQIRPIDVDAIRDRRLPITTDCSGSTVQLNKAAGNPDPSGNEYDGGRTRPTFTGTLRSTLREIRLADAHVGDQIIYGDGNGDHVVVIAKPHPTNPVVFSHGQEAGPFFTTHAVEIKAHGGYFTVHHGRAAA